MTVISSSHFIGMISETLRCRLPSSVPSRMSYRRKLSMAYIIHSGLKTRLGPHIAAGNLKLAAIHRHGGIL